MAEVLRYVNISTSNTPGGNGTTNDVTGANRAYATLSEWEAAEQTDLVAAGDTHRVLCSNTGGPNSDSAQCLVDGWTTGPSNGITIEQNPTDRTFGVLDTSKYKMRGLVPDGCLDVRQNDVTVLYIQIERNQPGTSSSNRRGMQCRSEGGKILVDGVIIAGVDAASTGSGVLWGILCDASANDVDINNCVVYDLTHPTKTYVGINVSTSGGTHKIVNETLINNDTNLSVSGTSVLCKNTVFQDGGTDVSGTLGAGSDYNLTDQGTFPVGSNNVTSATLTFRDKANDDFHLDSTDTAAIGAGIGPSSDSDVPTVDVDGDTRSGTITDIGFDLFLTAGVIVSVPSGSYEFVGYQPAITATNNQFVDIPVGSYELAGYGPTVQLSDNQFIDIPVGSYELTGQVPVVQLGGNQLVGVPTGSYEFTGQVPAVGITGPVSISVPAGNYALEGLPPVVKTGGWIVQSDETTIWTIQI